LRRALALQEVFDLSRNRNIATTRDESSSHLHMVFELAYLSCASLKPSAFAGCGARHHVAIQLRAAFADQASRSRREHARKAALDFQT